MQVGKMNNILDSVESFAREMANNHAEFRDFGWYGRPENAEIWCIYYTHNRGSDLLEQSNAEVIKEKLQGEEFENDVIFQRHNHWAVGWVEGVVIRVYNEGGDITEAFKALYDIKTSLEDYPLLDEDDFSKKEYQSAIDSIGERSKFVSDNPPDDWKEQVYSCLWDSTHELENRDGTGAYPSDESIKETLRELDLLDEYYWPEQAICCKVCGCFTKREIYGRIDTMESPRHAPISDEAGFALTCEMGGKECLGSGLESPVVDLE